MLYLDYGRKEGEWIPNIHGGNENLEAVAFLRQANELIFQYFPGTIMAAEESTAWPAVSRPAYVGGLGFNFKWNMGWMHDTLLYMSKDPVHRKYHQNLLTFSLLYAFHENFILPLSHDEVVHGKYSLLDKMPGDYGQKFANLRLLLGYMLGHPGKKLLFMGGEIGQWNEWNFEKSLDWNLLDFEAHRGLKRYVADLNLLLREQSALYELDFEHQGFEWIDINDTDNSTISFLRKAKNSVDLLIFMCNFTPVMREKYLLGVPRPGYYSELLNSDARVYGGSGVGNWGGVEAREKSWHGRPYSLKITLPPLAMLVFKPRE
jgi:1,4-alpha-glucan branching enzyme